MATYDSGQAYAVYNDGLQKFDHFMIAATGAVFAYFTQSYTPQKIGWSPLTWLEPLALVFLVAAFYMGLRKLETGIVVSRECYRVLARQEDAKKITLVLKEGLTTPGTPYNVETGEIRTPAELVAMRETLNAEIAAIDEHIEKESEDSEYYYKWRNRLLMAAFVALFLAKFLKPYLLPKILLS